MHAGVAEAELGLAGDLVRQPLDELGEVGPDPPEQLRDDPDVADLAAELLAEVVAHGEGRRTACVIGQEAVELVPEGTPTVVYSDSNLAVRTITEWAEGWERRGWKRKSGPVENLDLVKQAYQAYRSRPELELRWIKAHVGFRWNEYADQLANRGREEG